MNIFLMAISLIIGGLITWMVTHAYYTKSNKKQEKQNTLLSKKLSNEVKDIILTYANDNISVIELNKLLEKKTIDKSRCAKGDPLPWIVCPKCGNEELIRNTLFDNKHDEVYYIIKCSKCTWNEWSQ